MSVWYINSDPNAVEYHQEYFFNDLSKQIVRKNPQATIQSVQAHETAKGRSQDGACQQVLHYTSPNCREEQTRQQFYFRSPFLTIGVCHVFQKERVQLFKE